jgi:hypothetical protein
MPSDPATPAGSRHDWLASLLLRRPELVSRFQSTYEQLLSLPRHARRRLRRAGAGGRGRARRSLAAAALLLALSGGQLLVPRAHAANITVGGTCSLIDAIRSANDDMSIGTCATGSGADTITLTGDVTLTASYGNYYISATGLPLIDSEITIDGAGFTIARDGGAPPFRLLAVAPTGELTLRDVTLSGGYSQVSGGGVYVYQGTLSIIDSTISDNDANASGGGFYLYNGTMTLTNTVVSGNSADGGGGGYNEQGTLTITDSAFRDNYADEGGALYQDQDGGGALVVKTTITGSVIEDNTAGAQGGAIYLDIGEMTITDTLIAGNQADEGGGIYTYYPDADLTITGSTLYNNSGRDGGGLYIFRGDIHLVNSSLSGNHATSGDGGGIYNDEGAVHLSNVTVTGNDAAEQGGGVYQYDANASLTLSRSIISGNQSVEGSGHDVYISGGTVTADDHNVLGSAAATSAAAFTNFSPGATDVDASSDAGNVALTAILDPMLADNGGPTETHNLVDDSPAVDLAPDADCAAPPTGGVDQRGAARPYDVPGQGNDGSDTCDAGAVEFESPVPGDDIFVSAVSAGTTGDGVPFGPHDILKWDGTAWSKWFDGSAAGLMPMGRAVHNVNAVWIPDPSSDDALFSFVQNARVVPGIPGKVNGMDLVWWDGNAFSLWFDGEDVGLTVKTNEKIDAVHVLDGSLSPIGGNCDAYILLSTQGDGRVQDHTGAPLRFDGTDVLGFCMTNGGANTSGFWHRVLNGKAQGMPGEALTSLSASDDGQTLYFTTRAPFNVGGASGGHSMVYRYDVATQTFSGHHFSAPAAGLPRQVDGLQVEGVLP